MGETQIIDSRAMTPELSEHQSVLQKLWQVLERLPKVRTSEIIEIPSTLPVPFNTQSIFEDGKTPGVEGRLVKEEKVVGLEKGKLVAVKRFRSQPKSYDLLCLDADARYGTEFPLKPVIVTHDTNNLTLPVSIRVEEWPFGLKIHWGSSNGDWRAYHQEGTAYYELSEEVANQANEICKSIQHRQSLVRR